MAIFSSHTHTHTHILAVVDTCNSVKLYFNDWLALFDSCKFGTLDTWLLFIVSHANDLTLDCRRAFVSVFMIIALSGFHRSLYSDLLDVLPYFACCAAKLKSRNGPSIVCGLSALWFLLQKPVSFSSSSFSLRFIERDRKCSATTTKI